MDSQYSWRFDSTRSCTLRKKRLGQVVVVTKKSKYGQRSKQRREMSTAHSCHQQQCWNVQSNFFVHYLITVRIFTIFWSIIFIYFFVYLLLVFFKNNLIVWKICENVANNDGKCPLHIAAINNNVEMCKVIFCPLFYCYSCFTIFWLISFLFKNNQTGWKIRENVANNDRKSPLHIAAINNNVEMCKVFFFHYSSTNCYSVYQIQQQIPNLKIRIGFLIKWTRQRLKMSAAHSCHKQQCWNVQSNRSLFHC